MRKKFKDNNPFHIISFNLTYCGKTPIFIFIGVREKLAAIYK